MKHMDRRIRTAPLMDWTHELTSGFAQMFGGYSRLDAEARRLNVKFAVENAMPPVDSRPVRMKQSRFDKPMQGRRFHRLARLLAVAIVVFGVTFSAPAVACMCNCSIFSTPGKYPITAEPKPADYYDQVFSGLVIWTERTREPVVSPPFVVGKLPSGEDIVEYPGYWVRSRVLVLRLWRGAPATVAEVWTPIASDCDVPPIPGFHFVALVRTENGRTVAPNTYCDCVYKDAATEGRGAFAFGGISIVAAVLGIVVVVPFFLVKVVRRRRRAG